MSVITYFLIAISLSISSENVIKKKKCDSTIQIAKVSTETNFVFEYDTIIIEYWNGLNGKLNRLEIVNGNLTVYCERKLIRSDENSQIIKEELLGYVQQFYVYKTDNIILQKKRSEKALVTNYSSIAVNMSIAYRNVVNEKTQIGSEQYEIDFHPDFLKFYILIQELTSNCTG